jgi:microcystin-dependent protein
MGRETGQPYEESRVIPYIGEVRMFGFDFVPFCWAPCDGRLLPINDNQVLFSLLGTTFGGDGKTNFALPDLRGMVAPFKPLTFCIATEGLYPAPDSTPGALPHLGDDIPYLGEVNMFGFGFAPGGWASCDGRLLSIGEHLPLFDLFGTTFGGDGKNNFALPDLRGMVAPFKPLTFCIAMGGAFPPRGKPDPGSGANPYIGEVRMLGCNFAPGGWAACDGLLLPFKLGWKMEYDPYQALFSLVGTTFGGNGKTNFAVPDLRGMVAPFKPLTFCIAAEYAIGTLPQKPSGG